MREAPDRDGGSATGGAGDRAVSVTVGYVMTLAITSLLVSGLLVAGGSFVETERERAAQGELTVVGERIAADLTTVDRLAASAESPGDLTADRTLALPDRVSGVGYRVSVTTTDTEGTDGTEGTVRLESDRADTVVEVPFRTSKGIAVRNATVRGGDLRIYWDAEAGEDDGGKVVVSER